jgi:hypothetical protein
MALTAATILPVWTVQHVPLQDLPNHLLKVDLLRRLLADDPLAVQVYAINPRPIGNWTCYAVLLGLSVFMSLEMAGRVFVSACLLALPLGVWVALRRLNPDSLLLCLAIPAIGPSLFLNKGMLNFCAALALFAVALPLVHREATAAPGRSAAALGLLASALYLTHAFVFLALLSVAMAYALLHARTARWRSLALSFVPGILCFMGVLASEFASSRPSSGLLPAWQLPDAALAWEIVSWLFNADRWTWNRYLAVAWIVSFGTCVVVSLPVLRQAGRPQRLWLWLAACSAAAFILAPSGLGDWAHLRARLIPLTLLLALPGLSLPAGRLARLALVAIFSLASGAMAARQWADYHADSARITQYLSGVASLERGASLLPLDLEPARGGVHVNLHSWAYYQLARGGWGPYLHAYGTYHPIVYRRHVWAPPEDVQQRELTTALFDRVAGCYDALLLWAPDAATERAAAPSFAELYRNGSLLLARSRKHVDLQAPECRETVAVPYPRG